MFYSFGDLPLLTGASIADPREKKKMSSQSYCHFALPLLHLLSSSDLFNFSLETILFRYCTQDSPLNTEQCLPIAIIDNTIYNNESDGNN